MKSYELNRITDVNIFDPSLPYVMNLNLAGVLANEMTRIHLGKNISIVYAETDSRAYEIVLSDISGCEPNVIKRALELSNASTVRADISDDGREF